MSTVWSAFEEILLWREIIQNKKDIDNLIPPHYLISPIIEMKEKYMKELVKIHKALSDPNRLWILKMLQIRSLCVCEITSILNLATSTVSKHLAILREANLITDSKDGKWVNFQLNDSRESPYPAAIIKQLTGWLQDDKTIQQDALKVRAADRFKICHIN